MIKNAAHLSFDEMDSFRRLYKNYFMNLDKTDPSNWGSKMELLTNALVSGIYTDTMMGRINDNERLGFVYSNNDIVYGFIVGRLYPDSEGLISHFDIDDKLESNYRRLIALELFKRMATEMKRYGKTSVAVNSKYYHKDFNNMLRGLGFKEKAIYEDGDIEYGRQL